MVTQTRPAIILQILAAVALLAYAGLATLSGWDRMSFRDPDVQGFVGWVYDAGAARNQANRLLPTAGPAGTLALYRRALLSDPVDAHAIGDWGRALLLANRQAEAEAVFRVSGKIGWRDPSTQIFWFQRAIAVGDMPVAAQRLDALLRQDPDIAVRDALISILLQTDEGRNALVERLRAVPAWAEIFARNTGTLGVADLDGRADVMLRTGPNVWDCPTASGLVDHLIQANLLDDARRVWDMACAQSNALLFDGNFQQFGQMPLHRAFDWRVLDRGDVEVTPGSGDNNASWIDVRQTASSPLAVLRQFVVLDPGTYQVSWQLPGADDKTARAVTVSLDCDTDLADALEGTARGNDRYTATFTLDNECGARMLALWLRPGPQVRITNVQIVPAGPSTAH